MTVGLLQSNLTTASFTVNNVDDAPVAKTTVSPTSFDEDTPTVVTLSYTDADNNLATSCAVTAVSNLQASPSCSCDLAGVCTTTLTGTNNFNGSASFTYRVTANGVNSATITPSLTINAVDDAPTAYNITPSAFNQNQPTSITLSYNDTENDQATSCSITGTTNVTVSQACACVSGACTVGVTGATAGSASFTYTVTANTLTSLEATASLTINSVNNNPTISAVSNTTTGFNQATSVLFTISDVETTLSCNATFLSKTSSNTTLIPTANITFSGAAPDCAASITPAASQSGTSNITITVADSNGGTASTTFTLTVTDGTVILTWLNGTTVITSYNFGNQPANNTSASLTLKNTGTGTTPTAPTIALGTGTSNTFTIFSNSCGVALAPNSTCGVVLRWKSVGNAGLKSGTVQATSGTYTGTLSLSGTR